MFFKSAIEAVRRGLFRTASAVGAGLRSVLHGRQLNDALIDEVEAQLISADVGARAARELVESLRVEFRAGRVERGEDALEHLKRRMKERLAPPAGTTMEIAATTAKPAVILVVGVNGVGKTTSVAKIAHSIRASGRTVLLAAADTYRAGAVAQLQVWAQRLGVDIIRGTPGGDPAAVAFDAAEAAVTRGVDVLLVDTAGRLHNEENLMRQLVKIRDVIRRRIPGAPHETLLVLDATSGQNALVQAAAFQKAVDISGIFLAKMDGTARGGVVIAIHDALGVPVKLIGVGETPEDVQPFDADRFIDAVFSVHGATIPPVIRRAQGFTLIETIVVISIITLLVGFIMPAFNMVKRESHNTNCLSNLRQNFTAWQSYQTANKGVMPMCDFLPVVTPQGVEGGLPNLLSKFTPVDDRTWLCPADLDPDSTGTGTSYTYLPGLLRFTPQVQLEVLQVLLNLPVTTSERQRDIVRLQTESKLVSTLFQNDTKGLFPILMDSADRHSGTRVPRNGVYLDGAARAIKVEQTVTAD